MGFWDDFFYGAPDYLSFRQFLAAASNGDDASVSKYLIKKPDDINRLEPLTGMTALMCATVKSAASTVKMLLDKGASISGQDKNGYNVLHMAVLCSPLEIVELFLKRADVAALINEKNRHNGATALIYATTIAQDPALIQRLLDCGADPTLKDYNGRTALSIAKANGHTKTVALLEQWKPKPKPRPHPHGGRFEI